MGENPSENRLGTISRRSGCVDESVNACLRGDQSWVRLWKMADLLNGARGTGAASNVGADIEVRFGRKHKGSQHLAHGLVRPQFINQQFQCLAEHSHCDLTAREAAQL